MAEIPDITSLNKEVDPELSRILTKMVAKDPAERYQSCHELIDDLSRHPLVAKGGPITLQTKLSPAAATMVGQKTPVSAQRPLPSINPTPRSSSAPVVAPVPAHESVLARAPATASRSSALPFAIAAVLLLAFAGGAYAFRDRIPFLQQYLGTPAASASSDTPSTSSASSAVATTTSAPATVPPVVTSPAPPTSPIVDTNAAATTSTAQSTGQTINVPPTPPQSIPQAPAAANAGGPAARASEVQPLRELAAAQAAESQPQAREPQQVARVTPPPPVVPARPHVPTIAVIGGGDNAIAGPAEQMVEQALSHRGFNVLDEASMPRVGHLLSGERPRYAEALDILARQGRVDAVVFIHARDVGSEQLAYYGQSSTVTSVQLGIKAYSIDQHRALGPGWSETLRYSSLNAADATKETVEPMLKEVEESLAEFRPHRDRG